ncbi:MAG: hypothetical protein O3A46_00910 [Candidatus Poribacteria bacterium]|nr:hypothetical protein [Candidatus Poribacteria bacterium]
MTLRALGLTALALSLTVSATAKVTLEPDKARYAPGETIWLTVFNNTRAEIMWGSIGRYPEVWRLNANGKEELVHSLPQAMDAALSLLEPGTRAVWEWDQRGYLWDDDQQGLVIGGEDQIRVDEHHDQARAQQGNPEPRPLPRRMSPPDGLGTRVGDGRYIARLQTLPDLIESEPFRIDSRLAVEPNGKAATTWAVLKSR